MENRQNRKDMDNYGETLKHCSIPILTSFVANNVGLLASHT